MIEIIISIFATLFAVYLAVLLFYGIGKLVIVAFASVISFLIFSFTTLINMLIKYPLLWLLELPLLILFSIFTYHEGYVALLASILINNLIFLIIYNVYRIYKGLTISLSKKR